MPSGEVTAMRVYALCTGSIELDRASMVSDLKPGQPWTVPVTSFLVDHPSGRPLFDTGLHCEAAVATVAPLRPRPPPPGAPRPPRPARPGADEAPRRQVAGRRRRGAAAGAARPQARRCALRGQLAPALRSLRRQRVLPAGDLSRAASGAGISAPAGLRPELQPEPDRFRPSARLPHARR